MSFFESFVGKALTEDGKPSSKRLTGFIMIMFALVMEFITLLIHLFNKEIEGMGYDVFVTLLVSGLAALGISQVGKIQEHIAKKK
ncbi:MAG: hypothetical protein ACPGSG_11415 [Prolixibacteraceae bacterium]